MSRGTMTSGEGAVAIRVCFRSALKNTDLIIGTGDISRARTVARIWGERAEGEPVTRTVFQGMVPRPSTDPEVIGDVPVWPPVF